MKIPKCLVVSSFVMRNPVRISLVVCFFMLLIAPRLQAVPAVTGSREVIKDTFNVKLEPVPPICIDGSVVLSCPPDLKDVLEYKWINKATGAVISSEPSVLVKPTETTVYELHVTYIDKSDERIKNWNFEKGEPGFRDDVATFLGFKSAYKYQRNGNGSALYGEGLYKMGRNPNDYHNDFMRIGDHTTGKGYMMIINGNTGWNVKVWEQQISGLVPGDMYAFSMWAVPVHPTAPPKLHFSINGDGNSWETFSPVANEKWQVFFRIWTANATTATISLVNDITAQNGNDFALDDFSFAPVSIGIGEVTVKVVPRIEVARLVNSEVCEGADLDIRATLSAGSEISGYKWYKGSQLVSNTDLLAIRHADALRDGGVYSCKATGICGSDSVSFNLAVRDTLEVKPLTDTTVCLNSRFVWWATPTAGYEPEYEWNGGSPGWISKTTPAYSKMNVSLADKGEYICRVHNRCGEKFISANLDIVPGLEIIDISPDTTVCIGASVALWVKGNLSLTRVRWKSPSGAVFTGDTLCLQRVTERDGGTYTCEAISSCGVARTGYVHVDVHSVPGMLTVTEKQQKCLGENVQFKATVVGEGLRYAWTGPNGFTSGNATIQLSPIAYRHEGKYMVTVTDTCGNVQTKETALEIRRPAAGLQITPGVTVCPGETVAFEVTGGGSELTGYRWSFPGGASSGTKVVLQNVQVAQLGEYVCRVTGACAVDTTLKTSLMLWNTLTATSNAGVFSVCSGETVRFRVNATGKNVQYRWEKDGVLLSFTGSEYAVSNIKLEQAGRYRCMVSADCGSSISFDFELRLKPQTRITDKSSDKDMAEHEALHLFVNADGVNNKYQWTRNGTTVLGAVSGNLFIPDIGVSGDIVFTCRVTGDCGSEVTTIRVHVGAYNVVVEDRTVTLCEGGSFNYKLSARPQNCTETANLSYCWTNGGDTVSRTSILELQDISAKDETTYRGSVWGSCGATVVNLSVTMLRKPQIIALKNNGVTMGDTLTLCGGDDAHISSQYSGDRVVSVEWFRRGVLVATGDELSITDANSESDRGEYTCIVNGECGRAAKKFVVMIHRKLKILDYQPHLEVCLGQLAEFDVTATGYNEEYHWSGPGTGWVGGTSSTYRKDVASPSDAGKYRCIVSSSCGTDTVYSVLAVEKKLVLVDVVGNQRVCRNTPIELFVTSGSDNAKYKWLLPDGTTRAERSFTVYVTPLDTGVYTYVVRAKCDTVTGTVHVGLNREMSDLTITGNPIRCEHDTVHFVASVTGDGLSYRWMGPNQFTASTSSITIADVVESKQGNYELVVTDVCSTQKRASVQLLLLKDVELVSLNTVDTTVCPGSLVEFRVLHGTSGLTYNWMFRGASVGTGYTLLVKNVSPAQVGEYFCEVTGACVPRTLKTQLSLYERLVATAGETLLRKCQGENVRFTASAQGLNVEYHWKKEGRDVGAWGAELNINGVLPMDVGIYECHISSHCGDTVLSYELQLKEKTKIKSKTPDKFVCEYDPTTLFVRAQGENNVYTWWQNGVLLSEKSASLHIADVGETDTLVFTCAVVGDCGFDTANIRIKVGAFIPMEGQTDTLCEGSTYTYNLEVRPTNCYGNEPFRYYWIFNGDTISHESILRLENVSKANEGRYSCTVVEECGDTTVYLNVKVRLMPTIQSMTPDSYVIEGKPFVISVDAMGEELEYDWTKDKTTLTNNTSSIPFNPVFFEDRGIYEVTVKNRCGEANDDMELGVWQITIVVCPDERDTAVCAGADTRFYVEAWGEPGLVYSWYFNNELVASTHSPEWIQTSVTAEQAGWYTCVVRGRGGDDSCRINLTVHSLPQVEILGATELCWNERQIEYEGISDENRVDWLWQVKGGVIDGKNNRNKMQANWTADSDMTVYLTVMSLQTACSSNDSVQVMFKPRPDIYLDAPDLVGYCIDSLRLDFAYPSGGVYQVDGIDVENLYLLDKDRGYTLSYRYTDGVTGCADTVTDVVKIDIEPYIVIAADSVTVGGCLSTVLPVDEYSEGMIRWSPAIYLNSDTLLYPTFIPGVSQGYQVALTDKYGCRATDRLWVDVAEEPEIQLMSDTTIGECNDLRLTAVYYSNDVESLTWHPTNQVSVNSNGNVEVTGKKVGDNFYWATVTDQFGCHVSDTVMVTVRGTQQIASAQVCETAEPLVIDCSSFTAFSWGDEYAAPVRTLTEVGDYELYLTDRFGCTSESYFEVHPTPVLTIKDTFVFEGQTMEFILDLDPHYAPYDIRWQDGSAASVHRTEKAGYYGVKVSDNIGCSAIDSVYLEVRRMYIAAPNAFLPGSGNENAKFYLKEVDFVGNFEMYIYDRWGELIYKTNEIGINGGWDGGFKGMECLPGAYVWVAYNNGKIIGKGTVMLVK